MLTKATVSVFLDGGAVRRVASPLEVRVMLTEAIVLGEKTYFTIYVQPRPAQCTDRSGLGQTYIRWPYCASNLSLRRKGA